MALILPQNVDFKYSPGEKFVYYFIKNNLPDSYIVYYNYSINNQEFDFAVLIPGDGIAVIEVKNWISNRIESVIDRNCIRYKNSNGKIITETSPLSQAKRYSYNFMEMINDEIDKNIKVLPFVCYPEINKNEYLANSLDKVSEFELTILEEDFIDGDNFREKILEAFAKFGPSNIDYFSKEHLVQVRKYFEPAESIIRLGNEQKRKKQNDKLQEQVKNKRLNYSILQSISSEASQTELNECKSYLIKQWKKGTKIFLISNSKTILDEIKGCLEEEVYNLNLNDHLIDNKKEEKMFFNFKFYHTDDNDNNFQKLQIKNGNIEGHENPLKIFAKCSNFNLQQYKLEHADVKENIFIKAGAGTGKTFSMISRIAYLIYIDNLDDQSIQEYIVLITFTNEAANQMKQELQEYLQNIYLLTRDYKFFNMIQSIEDMKIGTIHSLAKYILKMFTAKLGLGRDFEIVTGMYQRNQILEEVLNDYIKKASKVDPEFVSNLNLSMYNLKKRLKSILEQLDNKNLDIINDRLDFGNSDSPEFDAVVKEVLVKSENHLRDQLKKDNKLRLNQIIIELKNLLRNKALSFEDVKVRYVFIDEFQDTDNIQIELLKEFQNLLDFNLFVVGDIKQCIYRFRGAEDRAFSHLVDGEEKEWGLSYKFNKNYRSDSLLLQKFENIFSHWKDRNLLDYGAEEKLISYLNYNNKNDNYFEEIKINDESEFEEKLIKTLKRKREELNNEDMAILVRENKDVKRVLNLGRKNGIYIKADVGGNLYRLESTIDFYKLILALQHPNTPKYLFNLYETNYIEKEIPKEHLYLIKNKEEKLLDFFYEACPIKNWNDYLIRLKKEPVLKVLRDLVKNIKPWMIYGEKISDMADKKSEVQFKRDYKRNLDVLFEKLIELGSSDYLTLNKISDYLHVMIVTEQEEESRRLKRTEKECEGNILCMTVHKAKGLEFNFVLLPITNKDMTNPKKWGTVDVITKYHEISDYDRKVGYNIRLDKEINGSYNLMNNHYDDEKDDEREAKLKEETRILYVAMTRAIKSFCYFNYSDCNIKNSWQSLIKGGL